MSKLSELLEDSAVELHGTAVNWKEAIRTAGGLLENTGAITGDYIQEMITSVEDNGPYIVVAPGFAFAHARPSEAVRRTAISWLRLDEPVRFGHGTNDPVTLVVALAAQDDKAHTKAMSELAKILGNKTKRERLDTVESVDELREALGDSKAEVKGTSVSTASSTHQVAEDSVASKGKIYTVCGNGLGTSLFLKNTLEQVLDVWGWGPYLTVEATDTISAKGRAKEADFLLTSGEIAATLGDVGVPVYVIEDFTNQQEIDAALRELYDV
ncbi:MAG: PTS sugar transporter subunit IIA [Corynebacterium camporealensis]|uniref:PTS sugar transporter subunit IIA n=1 Tax=Corynebacterium camporealensis TaxID=161896 RepID=UPI002A90914E|nr:PTS sugar transporter subunit IIA [Corynebacterium camporealensis]MDY5839750.1 PTS sugar transporter subunit IIA [Corynebacterium camporealensis]